MRRSLASFVLGSLAALVLAGSIHASDPGIPIETSSVPEGISYESSHEGVPSDASLVAYLPRFWAEVDYLVLWARGAPIPPLISTGTALGPGNAPGTLGLPGTMVLIGGDIGHDASSGVRFTVGGWLDDGCKYGIEASYFYLGEQSSSESIGSRGTPGSQPLSIPFFNAAINMESSAPIALDRAVGPIGGQAEVSVSHRAWGAEALGLCCLHESRGYRLDLVGGYRYLNIEESLDFTTSSSNVGQDDIFRTRDSFNCKNEFHGLQVGLRNQIYAGRVYFRGTAKLALGNMNQTSRIDGSFVTNDFPELAGQTRAFRGGYFSQPTNIGSNSRNRFTFIPETSAGVGLHLCPWLRVSVSYTFLYVGSVLRPGDQMDRVINATQSPAITGSSNATLNGVARPQNTLESTDYWLQGLNFGLEVRF